MKKKASGRLSGCTKRSLCPISSTLDLIGDKWTLLIIRDMFFINKRSFQDFLSSPEKIATNILTDRLKKLEEHGIIEKRPYSKAPLRYEYMLTQRGKDLKPVLFELSRWGNTHIEGTFVPSKEVLEKIRPQFASHKERP